MKRFLLFALALLVVLAVSVYRAKLGAQSSHEEIAKIEAEIARLEQELAVLRAEEAHLERPDRIGPLAKDHLGLGRMSPDQYVDIDALENDPRLAPTEAPQ
ncbi:MAG: cell division protein FtsL [Pseudomonadota bacterium]